MSGKTLILAMVTLAVAVIAAPLAATPPLEAFGHLPSVDEVAVSPDGKAVALIAGDENGRQIQIRDTTDMRLISNMMAGQAKIRSLGWAGDNHLIIASSMTAQVYGLTGPRREYLGLIDINLTTRKTIRLLNGDIPDVRQKLNTAADIPVVRTIGGKPVAFVEGTTFPDYRGVLTLFQIDLDSGRTRKIALGDESTRGWVIDEAGAISARVEYAESSGQWTLWTRRAGHLISSVTMTRPLDPPSVMGLGRAADTVLVRVPGEEQMVFHEVTLGNDRLSEPIAALDGVPVHDRKTGLVMGVARYSGLTSTYTFFDPADAKLWAMVVKAFPKALVELASWSDDRSKIVLKVEGKDHGAAYYLLDVATRHARWIANEYAEIDPADVAERLAISYPAADGLPIPAYLTLPPGAKTKNLPLIVLPHGGPGARDEAGFDWWSQALASRGYAVLQPEFRGSTGFGVRFNAAGYGEWGRKMQTDLSDGVKYLAAAGTVDAKRVCIVGGSYGGYAALAGVALQSGVYRCAVSLAGPSDLRAMLSTETSNHDGGNNITLRFWKRFMGAKSASDPSLDAISPARFADHVEVPVLLIHGVDDTVVPFAQSKIMASALTRAGKQVELVTLKSEDHWLSRSATRTQMLQATTRFLAANLPVEAAKTVAIQASPVGR